MILPVCLRIINPESQKIGSPVIKPVIPSARALLFSPVLDNKYFAILSVPPVLSRVMPIIAPRIMRNPMEAIVFPNPSLIVETTIFAGSVVNARNNETIKSAMKAFSFNREVSITTAIILISTRKDFSQTTIVKV